MGLTDHDETMVQKGWSIVEKNQNKISTMVMDMLTFSKEREPDLAPTDLNAVVEDVVELMQARAGELNVKLEWTPDATLPTLQCDSEAMHRAVLNVVTNAIDACDGRTDGRVEVSTHYLPEKDRRTSSSTTTASALPPSSCRKSSRCSCPTKGLAARGSACR